VGAGAHIIQVRRRGLVTRPRIFSTAPTDEANQVSSEDKDMQRNEANESYRLAEEYVCEKIRIALDGETTGLSRRVVLVKGLEDCDCIPVVLENGPGGKWDLLEVARWHVTHLHAAYEAR
jgi:hypothetical protein